MIQLDRNKLVLACVRDMTSEIVETIKAHGHRLVKARHKTTFEFTKEEELTSEGDCILAVGASKGISELSAEFRNLAARDSTRITILIEVDGLCETAVGMGSSSLGFTNATDVVARRSSFTCGRTVMIRSNKAAVDFSRALVRRLRNPDATVHIALIARS